MRHSACRKALLNGDLNPAVAEHLDECERCLAFSRDLAQVGEYAQAMAPGPAPGGLADRVIAGVRSAAETGDVIDLDVEQAAEEVRPGWAGQPRGPLLVTLSLAAVLTLLVGVLAVFPREGDDDSAPGVAAPEVVEPLLTAAERTLEAGTARVRLSGTTTATISPPDEVTLPEVSLPAAAEAFEPPPFTPPPEPDSASLPPEQQEEAHRQYEAQVDEMRRQYDAYVAEARAQYEAFRASAGAGFAGLEIPDEFTFEMRVSGAGAVEFPSRLRIDGTMEVTSASPALPTDPSGAFGIAVDGDRTLVKGPDGAWVEVPGAAGPMAAMLADPAAVAAFLRGARGSVTDLGREDLDGFAVRHYRFDVAASVFAPEGTEGEGTAEAWIGVDDGVVHKLQTTSSSDHRDESGFASSMHSQMTLELFDFGADVEVEMPSGSGSSSSGLGIGALLTPYDKEMPAGFFYAPPEVRDPPSFEQLGPAPTSPSTQP